MSFLSFFSELFGSSNGSAQAVSDDEILSSDFRLGSDAFVETNSRPKSKVQETAPAPARASSPSARERKLEAESRRRKVTQVKERLHKASKELDDTISDIKMKA